MQGSERQHGHYLTQHIDTQKFLKSLQKIEVLSLICVSNVYIQYNTDSQ